MTDEARESIGIFTTSHMDWLNERVLGQQPAAEAAPTKEGDGDGSGETEQGDPEGSG